VRSQRISGVGLLSRALRLSPEKLDPTCRGFAPAATSDVQARLAAVVSSFAHGYNYALEPDAAPEPTSLPQELVGFAVEGAAMSCALLDVITFSGGRRVAWLAEGYGDRYPHLIHVGAGWAYARLHRRPWHGIGYGQQLLRWLAWDGWGFHQAFFAPERVFVRHEIERAARSDVRPIRDQGIGRALWFYAGAEPENIATRIAGFPPERRCDLWAGIALAACYTGAQPPEVLDRLIRAAGDYRDHLGQGAAFAAKAHVLSGAVPKASAACIETLADAASAVAAEWTDESFARAGNGPDTPAAYQAWRAGIRDAFSRHRQGVPR
jgi:enediyne biosynthesis protein E3